MNIKANANPNPDNIGGGRDAEPRLPHEADQTPSGTPSKPRHVMKQAFDDLQHGLVDTDLHGDRGVEEVVKHANANRNTGYAMERTLPPLPYELDALEPYLSRETLEYHYRKHHQAYVTNLNNLIQGTGFESADLEDIIKQSSGAIFNNASQIWNHTFYWNSMKPHSGGQPGGALSHAIYEAWGSIEKFKEDFAKSCMSNFGSGWTWLVKTEDGSLAIFNTANATSVLNGTSKPLLTCDVWEHAYYIDYRNLRQKYIDAFWNVVNWDFAERNFA